MVTAVYVVAWFKDQEISLAMGLSQLTLLVSFLGGWMIPIIAEKQGIGNAFGAGALACAISFCVACSLIYLDNKAKKHDDKLKLQYKKS